jgi:hypothetical protein
MKRIVFCAAALALALFSIPAASYEYPWKTLPPFEIDAKAYETTIIK